MGGQAKYKNRKVEYKGILFDSKKEAMRYQELKLMQDEGIIYGLRRQAKYVLIPAQYEKVGKKKKCIERECVYYADFEYKREEDGELVVEDTKGVRTKDYIIKRKLLLYVHGIRIQEI